MTCAFLVLTNMSTGFLDAGSQEIFFVSKLPGGPGIGYVSTSLVFGSTRKIQSHVWLGRYTRPFVSGTLDVYGLLYLCGSFHSEYFFAFVSNIPASSAP